MGVQGYQTLILNIEEDVAVCVVKVGKVELKLPFPLDVLEAHQLEAGDRFLWHPTEDGSISSANTEVLERRENHDEIKITFKEAAEVFRKIKEAKKPAG